MIKKWVKKPVVIEAVQWTGDNAGELRELGFEGYIAGIEIGTYVVKEADGKFCAYSKSAFHEVYERHLVWDENI